MRRPRRWRAWSRQGGFPDCAGDAQTLEELDVADLPRWGELPTLLLSRDDLAHDPLLIKALHSRIKSQSPTIPRWQTDAVTPR